MGTISLSIPQVGQPDTTEDVKIQNNFTAIQNVINGNLDTNNISPTAGILGTQLAAAAAIKYSQLATGAWQALTLAGGVSAAAGSYTPSVRLEGDVVRLKGIIQNTSGAGITAGTTLATLPVGTTPGANAPIESYSPTAILTIIQATTGGVLSLISAGGTSWAASGTFNLNGKTYTLS